jgi:ABC-type glycerol-3-phosphate transport system substrate-binding protein
MKGTEAYFTLSTGALLLAAALIACSSVQEQTTAPAQKATPEQAKAAAEGRGPAEAKVSKSEAKESRTKAVEVEGVISSVGQRTITFQVERKGKVREEVVGVDDKTNIEKAGSRVKLKDLQETDKALINYEPEAYTPAAAIKVTGQGKLQKVGGDD